eukprot:m.76643 g.76643  ORF g.76643 m.76643 type:complete len:69 (-) comp14035_c0_seq2:22-228(-)
MSSSSSLPTYPSDPGRRVEPTSIIQSTNQLIDPINHLLLSLFCLCLCFLCMRVQRFSAVSSRFIDTDG